MRLAQLGRKSLPVLSNKKYSVTGRDLRRMNILVARAVAETIRPMLGPKGMEKILVSYTGDVKITNDGATVLKDIEIVHPVAKMMVEVAEAQEKGVGDGSTTAVVLAGELLRGGEELLDQGLHPTIIAKGYKLAMDKMREFLDDVVMVVSEGDEDLLRKVAMTAMAGKVSDESKGYLADLLVRAVRMVSEDRDGKIFVDKDYIKLEKRVGGGVEDTLLVQGFLIDKRRLNPSMPEKVEGAKIALLLEPLKAKDTRSSQKEIAIDMEARIGKGDELRAFIESEEAVEKDLVDRIKKVGANVLFLNKGVGDVAQHYLLRENIFTVSGVKDSDMKVLAKTAGANAVPNPDHLNREDLGSAGVVEEITVDGDHMVCVRDCKNPRSVSFLVRGSTKHIVDEVERSIEDCVAVVSTVMVEKRVVPGGGAFEVEVARRLGQYAKTVGGKESLAIEVFAKALEVVPKTLAENAGLDPINVLINLRVKHEEGGVGMGIDLSDDKVKDVFQEGIIEPLKVKVQAINAATEFAVMLLRTDDVIMGKK